MPAGPVHDEAWLGEERLLSTQSFPSFSRRDPALSRRTRRPMGLTLSVLFLALLYMDPQLRPSAWFDDSEQLSLGGS
jgi:hypothetical protein